MSNHVRLACDRCRGQKLRCLRVGRSQNDEACARCQRAGALCVTSSPRRLGRPRITASGRGASVSSEFAQGHREYDSPDLQTPSWRTAGLVNATTGNVLDNFPTWLHGVTRPGSASIRNDSITESRIPTNPDSFLNFQVPTIDDLLQTADASLNTPDGRLFDDLAIMTGKGGDQSPQQDHMADAIIRLSQLNESLARHKFQIETHPWGVPPDQRLCAGTASEVETHPVAQALQSASEYIAILEWLVSLSTWSNASPATEPVCLGPLGSDTSHCDLSPSPLSPRPEGSNAEGMYPFSRTVMLLLLSSYLQIIELYSSVFGHMCQVLREIPDRVSFFQRSSEFRVAGIPPMKAQLYIRIMVQVSENHLHSIERLMGLPPELYLSTQPFCIKGIFSGVDSSGLLRAALGQADEGQERDSATSLVASLKENLQSLHRLLPT